jgi:hypothetical protein
MPACPTTNRVSAWLLATLVALLALGSAVSVGSAGLAGSAGMAGSPVNLAALAVLALGAALMWSLWRPPTRTPFGVGRRIPTAAHLRGPLRSTDPDAPGRPRPRAPGV